MIAVILFWLYTTCLFYLYGWVSISVFRKMMGVKTPSRVSFVTTWMVGLSVVTTLANFLSLGMKLSFEANLVFLIGGLLIAGWMIRRKEVPSLKIPESLPPVASLLMILVTLTLLEKATHPVANPDTGLYHAQAIRWMETFPVVPGLGNLHMRFAYNSSWLTANSLFSFAFLGFQSFHLVSSTIFLIFQVYLFGGIAGLLKQEYTVSNFLKTLLVPVSFYVIISQISSPGTDLPSALFVWYIILEWVSLSEKGRPIPPIQWMLLSFIAMFTVTVKLSAIPIVLVVIFFGFQLLRSKKWQQLAALGFLALFIFTPWMTRNVYLSGYLIYPYTAIDLFDVDWKVPVKNVQADSDAIRAWGRIPRQVVSTTLAMPFSKWFPLWFSSHTLNQKIILWIIVTFPFLFILAGFPRNDSGRTITGFIRKTWLAYLMTYMGFLFWFLSAPQYRFGYGFLFGAFLLSLAPFWAYAKKWVEKTPAVFPAIIITGVMLFQLLVLARSVRLETLTQRLFLPADYITLPTAPCRIMDRTVWCAEWYDECWYTPFPCVPRADPKVGLRGEDIQDGFRYYEE